MNQRTTTLCLTRKVLSAVEINADVVAALGPESMSYPSVTHYLRQAKSATSNPRIIFSEPEPELDDSDETILVTLSE
jgi:hypothetical protein